jgi:AcrR family transcriptional regulator
VARTLDPVAHAIRRDAFVDAAQRLMQTKGYARMSIEDVLDATQASKGAFYHYFGSKAALREAVMERMMDQATAVLQPVIDDPGLSALEKLHGFFAGIARWKGERTELLTGFLEVWMGDDNAQVRERYRQLIVRRITPVLASIIEQGQAEGTFAVSHPRATARVAVSLILGANETATELYFARQADAIPFEDVEPQLRAYTDAMERVLGVPPGSWPIVDPAILRQWFG